MRAISHIDPVTRTARGLTAAALVSLLLGGCFGDSTQSPEPAPPAASSVSPYGLDARPANATCRAWPRPTAASSITLEPYADVTVEGVSISMMVQPPKDNSRWYFTELPGTVKTFTGSGADVSTVLDITPKVRFGGEMGLLGIAIHPDFPEDPRIFLAYTGGDPIVLTVSSFTTPDGGATLDPASEQVVFKIDHPDTTHNGGHIAFGPDGYLYFGTGDGGGGGDQHGNPGNGQSLTALLGKMLRVDVDSGTPYAIPPGNPFAGNPPCPSSGRTTGECPEIYAWGFRNPWRWSFDRNNGDLWLGDVGQGAWEEVNKVSMGGNYGWRCREGAHDQNSAGTIGCDRGGLIDPIAEYKNGAASSSITGGYVYRGTQDTALRGRYLFGDFGSGRIWAWLPENASTTREPTLLLDSSLYISSFTEGNDGELYVVSYRGSLHHIVFEEQAESGAVPEKLSETGCADPADPRLPASALIPYAINSPLWSDGAQKDRWLAVPDDQQITLQPDGDWDLPPGSVLVKQFRFGGRRVETRLLMRHPDGNWGGYTYEWNAAQTDATLLREGATRDLGYGRTWTFPSESQCLDCHTSAAGRSLGLQTAQLNRNLKYASTGRTANQLATLDHIGILSPEVPDATAEPQLPDPADASAPLDDRARAYLHSNCSGCHRPGGPTPSNMDLRYTIALDSTNACNATPQSGDLGIGEQARLIAPGSSANSVLLNRLSRRDENAMPPLGTAHVDDAAVILMTSWIDSLDGC